MNEIPNYPQIAAVVYQAAANYDPYLPPLSPDLAQSWAKAFEKYALNLEDLLAAVDRIYAEVIDFQLRGPARIVQMAREIRHDRAQREPAAEFEARQADTARHIKARVAEIAAAQTIPDADGEPKRRPSLGLLSVPCSYCHASVGRPCIAQSTGRPMREGQRAHPSRIDAAMAAPPTPPQPVEDAVLTLCPACHTRFLTNDHDTTCDHCAPHINPHPKTTPHQHRNGDTA